MGRRLAARDGERGNGLAEIKTGRGQCVTDKKVIKCILFSAFLIAITILPSYEAIDLRYRKSVDISENTASYQLQEGDVIEQKLILDKNDRIDDLRVWVSADTAKQNRGTMQIILTQDAVLAESRIDTSQIVGEEYVPTHLKLARFTDGELLLRITVEELDNDASVSIRRTSGGAIYGLPEATINGKPCNGTLSLSYEICQPYDKEFLISLLLALIIFIFSIMSSYVMTYMDETPKTGWIMMALFVIIAMSTYSLEFPAMTWQADARYEGLTFFYHNVANMGILESIRQLEGGMYLSLVQNIIMIIAVKVLGLRQYAFVFCYSMGILYLALCLAPFCSHYFKSVFTRTFRFICSIIIVCYSPIFAEFIGAGYYGAFFLVLLLAYDFEEINKFVYAFIIMIIPVVCMSKMFFVVFVPVSILYYLLFRKEMNRKKKCCICMMGISSFLEGLLSIIMRNGVASGHTLGTIQQASLPTLINKTLYYLVQSFGIQFRCAMSNSNQFLVNICMSLLVAGILIFTIRQITRKGTYKSDAKFILVMFSFIAAQCVMILLTTTDWHADISWKQSLNSIPGKYFHYLNLYIAASTILLTILWICLKYAKSRLVHLQGHLGIQDHAAIRIFIAFTAVVVTFAYIDQHATTKNYGSANPAISEKMDWKTYCSMLDSDSFCIRYVGGNSFYTRDAFAKSVAISRCASIDLSTVPELNGKQAIVFYTHKTAATNQILDRYYYMSLYDKDGNLISRLRQLNPDPERLYIAFYPDAGVANVGRVEFTYEDGSPAFVDETIEIGYR